MIKRMLSLTLTILLVNLVCYSSAAANPTSKEMKFAAKVEAAIAKLGAGPNARVEVSLRDKTKVKGYISEANKEGFIVMEEKTGVTTSLTYLQVKKVKGNNLSTGAKIAIGLGIAIFIIIGLVQIMNSNG